MWQYEQTTGILSKDGTKVGTGYSGNGYGKNNPAAEALGDVGPIPAGLWTFVGPPFDSSEHGPYVLRIVPKPGTVTFGRDGFLLHGDSIEDPGNASLGCMVQQKRTRVAVYQSGDVDLEVKP